MSAKLTIVNDIFDPGRLRDVTTARIGIKALSLAERKHDAVWVNGYRATEDQTIRDGDDVLVIRMSGDPVSIGTAIVVGLGKIATAVGSAVISSVISFALSYVTSLLIGAPRQPRVGDSPTYTGELGLLTRKVAGGPIPIVYGKHKAGGQVIWRATGHQAGVINSPSPAVSAFTFGARQLVVVSFSEGPVQSIGGITVDSDNLWFSSNASSRTLYQFLGLPRDNSVAIRDATARTRVAFAFSVPGGDAIVTSITMLMRHVGSIAAGKKLTVAIHGGAPGVPSSAPVAPAIDLPVSSIIANPRNPPWQPVTVTTSLKLTGGVAYWVVLEGDYSINGTDYIELGVQDTNGQGNILVHDGSQWPPGGLGSGQVSPETRLAVADIVASPNPYSGSDINVNGNPLEGSASDGNISLRMGNGYQWPVSQLSGVAREQVLSITLQKGQWFEATTIGEVDGFTVQLFYPNGHFQQGTQTIVNAQSYIAVEWRTTGSSTWQKSQIAAFNFGTLNRTGSAVRIDFRQDPNFSQFVGAQLDVRVRIPPDDSGLVTNTAAPIQWIGLRELTEDQAQSFPYLAYIALDTDLKTSQGAIDNVTALIEGKKMWVPSNGGTTWTYRHSSNNSHIILNLLMNARYGGGNIFSLDHVDIVSIETAADFCDELISDGEGGNGTIKRHEFNGIFDERKTLGEAIEQVAAAARLSPVWTGNKFRLKIERPRSITQIFTPGNTVEGTMEIEFLSKAKRPNAVDVEFLNEDLDYNQDVASHEDEDALASGETSRRESVSLYGETKWIRAKRQAIYYVKLARSLDTSVRFESFIEAVACEPGDVIGLSSDLFADTFGGRVKEDAADGISIKLDREVTLDAGKSYRITVRTHGTNADVIQSRDITTAAGTYPAGTTLDIDPSWDAGDLPKKYDPYSIGDGAATSDGLRLFNVTDIELTEDFHKRITAVNYDESVFSDDPGALKPTTFVRPLSTINGSDIPPDVTTLTLTNPRLVGGKAFMDANWTAAPWPLQYQFRVWGRIDSIGQVRFVNIGDTANTTWSFELPPGHTYTVAVTPLSPATQQHRNPNRTTQLTATRKVTWPAKQTPRAVGLGL